jgi:hypothetical protein
VKIPKAFIQQGSNQALQEAIFIRKMKEAEDLEVTLETKRFEVDNDQIRVVCSGKPHIVELELKSDCTAKAVLKAINSCLHEAHIYRDGMAKKLIGGT